MKFQLGICPNFYLAFFFRNKNSQNRAIIDCMKIGLDVGSTTLKCVVLDNDKDKNIIYKSYERHYSAVAEKVIALLERLGRELGAGEDERFDVCVSGSAGMGFAEHVGIPFVQEVYATRVATLRLVPDADVVIELGGEDAKILFLTDKDTAGNPTGAGMEVRMNGSCAGGTGAFIDQMATLLGLSPDELNAEAEKHEKIYTVASRCGVFAKSDIQPLLNQGARIPDVAASIFYAVVNQTIAGLAQGRKIEGKVVYLGGPLTFLSELRKSFDKVLGISGVCPDDSLYFVAIGAAELASGASAPGSVGMTIPELISAIKARKSVEAYIPARRLFSSKEEYDEFAARHSKAKVPRNPSPETYSGGAYLGVDAGSTTVKLALTDESGALLYTDYRPNSGNPVALVWEFLSDIYEKFPNIHIISSAVTGYGEEIIRGAFKFDYGIVETVAHFTAAKQFLPGVDFIIDIGGQDIKCFRIRNGAIDNIFLNEACSSGCGSFLQSFAGALGYSVEDFARLGLFADRPVDLGSRCTVFMNSSVKQSQKDGASIENISAGLSISVVKNALYKVIRVSAATIDEAMGKNIVVQGGTFYNDAVLRAFEQEIGRDVVRPDISGLMGAYGAALYAKSKSKPTDRSEIITAEELKIFTHEVRAVTCGLCGNNCRLTVNTFGGSERTRGKFIGGNRCDRPVAGAQHTEEEKRDDMYEYKLGLLLEYAEKKPQAPARRGRIGIPFGLNMYELLPFWHTILTKLGFEVVVSPPSSRNIYLIGQLTIPSDTVCFPAKLMHGHIEWLLSQGVDTIFYPCLTYNVDEGLGDNHYNCPVVAYYPEVIGANVPDLRGKTFISEYFGIHRPRDFEKKFAAAMRKYFPDITDAEARDAVRAGYAEYKAHMKRIREYGKNLIDSARKRGKRIIILAGRPYHVDPEINHGIDRLVTSLGAVVVTEDAVSWMVPKFKVGVLNQWTYHSRLYAAAKFATEHPDVDLVQLVSFGCGVDAITTDEVRAILERAGKIYTQIKIDEITNLGAVKIRLRSLFAALD